MILNYDQQADNFHAATQVKNPRHAVVIDSFCAVTKIVELLEARKLLLLYEPTGHEQWYLRVVSKDDFEQVETLPVAEPVLLVNSREPELFVKVWRLGRIQSLRCSFLDGGLEWNFCAPRPDVHYHIVSEAVPKPEEPHSVEVLESGISIHCISAKFSETDAQALMQRTTGALDKVSSEFLAHLSADIQQYWNATLCWPIYDFTHSSNVCGAEVSAVYPIADDCDAYLMHSYGVYGRRVREGRSTVEGLGMLKVQELLLPQPRERLTGYADDLTRVSQYLATKNHVVASTISAGSVPIALSLADDGPHYSGIIFDRCISANGSLYTSDTDNRNILKSLSPSARFQLGKGMEVAQSSIPILSFSSTFDSRVNCKDRLRFDWNLREDLIQLSVAGGHVNTPWDVDRLKKLISVAFLRTLIT